MGKKWFNKHRDQLRRNRLILAEQCYNANQTKILAWHHVKALENRKTKKTPSWYTEFAHTVVHTHPQRSLKLPINTLNRYTQYSEQMSTSREKQWYMSKQKGTNLIGKEIKRSDHTTKLRHYQQPNNLLPLIPCKGCELNQSNDHREELCLIHQEHTDLIQIPVALSIKSSSNIPSNMNLKSLISPKVSISSPHNSQTLSKPLKHL